MGAKSFTSVTSTARGRNGNQRRTVRMLPPPPAKSRSSMSARAAQEPTFAALDNREQCLVRLGEFSRTKLRILPCCFKKPSEVAGKPEKDSVKAICSFCLKLLRKNSKPCPFCRSPLDRRELAY